jgi:hypothetical protein
MLVEQKYPIAGTLNPCQPKQMISSFRVAGWATLGKAALIAAVRKFARQRQAAPVMRLHQNPPCHFFDR